MPNISKGQKIVQVQFDDEKVEKLDEISKRTYVPRTTLIRMAIDRFLEDAYNGRIQLGLSLTAPPSAGGPPPPPPGPAFTVVADPKQGG